MKKKLLKEVIWITIWIVISTIWALLVYVVCEDRASRFGIGALANMFLMLPYGISVMLSLKSTKMPVTAETFYYIGTMFYMAINVFGLAYTPSIYMSVSIWGFIVVTRVIHSICTQ